MKKILISSIVFFNLAFSMVSLIDQKHSGLTKNYIHFINNHNNISSLEKLELINNLGLSPKRFDQILKQELNKTLLETPLIPRFSQFSINTSFLKSIRTKLETSKDRYSKLTYYIITSILDEYQQYYAAGFINRYEKYNRGVPMEANMYRSLKKLIKLSSGWLRFFHTKSLPDFQKLMSQLCEEVELKIIQRAKAHKLHQSIKSKSAPLFSIKELIQINTQDAKAKEMIFDINTINADEGRDTAIQKLEQKL